MTHFSFVQARLRPSLLSLALQSAALATLGLGAAAQAQQAASTQHYELPAGPLAELLPRFASQSGLLISADAGLTQGRQSPGLRGDYSPREGLAALLAGTGLLAQ
ncbi:STN domain-containing protein, partial [Paucibacter sp. XJ19-41]|uniref:STN domain-containing protein n=1 Tax=Paucibacter sp. XJ19-41 TaxID=2927824 RepID=UPI00234A073C